MGSTDLPKMGALKEMEDRLHLPDENRDGVADKAITFAKVIILPGLNSGTVVLVGSAPDIWFLKDTDGDDVADVKIKMLGGIDSADTHHAMNNFQYGPDGGLYYQRGVFHVSMWKHLGRHLTNLVHQRCIVLTQEPSLSVSTLVIVPTLTELLWIVGLSLRNGWHRWQIISSCPKGNGFAMRSLLKKEVRPVASYGIISSANFPDEKQQAFMLCNTIGFLGPHITS